MDLFFAATHGGTTLGRDGPTVLMRVGLGLLKWIEPTVMKVTPNDSIQACMSIQEAGADLFSAAHIDMLLYTSFEDIGPLHTVQQMRARLATSTTEGSSNGRSAPAKSPARDFARAGAQKTRGRSQNAMMSDRSGMRAGGGEEQAPWTSGKRKRRAVARVWDEEAAKKKAQVVVRTAAQEDNAAKSQPPGLPVMSPGRPTASSSAKARRFKSGAAAALTLSTNLFGSPTGSPKRACSNLSAFAFAAGGAGSLARFSSAAVGCGS